MTSAHSPHQPDSQSHLHPHSCLYPQHPSVDFNFSNHLLVQLWKPFFSVRSTRAWAQLCQTGSLLRPSPPRHVPFQLVEHATQSLLRTWELHECETAVKVLADRFADCWFTGLPTAVSHPATALDSSRWLLGILESLDFLTRAQESFLRHCRHLIPTRAKVALQSLYNTAAPIDTLDHLRCLAIILLLRLGATEPALALHALPPGGRPIYASAAVEQLCRALLADDSRTIPLEDLLSPDAWLPSSDSDQSGPSSSSSQNPSSMSSTFVPTNLSLRSSELQHQSTSAGPFAPSIPSPAKPEQSTQTGGVGDVSAATTADCDPPHSQSSHEHSNIVSSLLCEGHRENGTDPLIGADLEDGDELSRQESLKVSGTPCPEGPLADPVAALSASSVENTVSSTTHACLKDVNSPSSCEDFEDAALQIFDTSRNTTLSPTSEVNSAANPAPDSATESAAATRGFASSSPPSPGSSVSCDSIVKQASPTASRDIDAHVSRAPLQSDLFVPEPPSKSEIPSSALASGTSQLIGQCDEVETSDLPSYDYPIPDQLALCEPAPAVRARRGKSNQNPRGSLNNLSVSGPTPEHVPRVTRSSRRSCQPVPTKPSQIPKKRTIQNVDPEPSPNEGTASRRSVEATIAPTPLSIGSPVAQSPPVSNRTRQKPKPLLLPKLGVQSRIAVEPATASPSPRVSSPVVQSPPASTRTRQKLLPLPLPKLGVASRIAVEPDVEPPLLRVSSPVAQLPPPSRKTRQKPKPQPLSKSTGPSTRSTRSSTTIQTAGPRASRIARVSSVQPVESVQTRTVSRCPFETRVPVVIIPPSPLLPESSTKTKPRPVRDAKNVEPRRSLRVRKK